MDKKKISLKVKEGHASPLENFCHKVISNPGAYGSDGDESMFANMYTDLPPFVDEGLFEAVQLAYVRKGVLDAVKVGETKLDRMFITDFILSHLLLSWLDGYSDLHENVYSDVRDFPIPEDVLDYVKKTCPLLTMD
jgi:hypothetical protein